jgi:hypothetical protein
MVVRNRSKAGDTQEVVRRRLVVLAHLESHVLTSGDIDSIAWRFHSYPRAG